MAKSLRLTGGSFSGRKLYVPARGTRPATNRVREAIFSILLGFFEKGVSGLRVLDLFAGSGSLGIEALSRGALSCTFVESGADACASIRKNLELLGISAEVVKTDVHRFLNRSRDLSYDLVFMDPPYRYVKMDETVRLLNKSMKRGIDPVLVYERIFSPEPPLLGAGVLLLKRKRYGGTEVLYYRMTGEEKA